MEAMCGGFEEEAPALVEPAMAKAVYRHDSG